MPGWTTRLIVALLVLPVLPPGSVSAAPAPLRGISVDLSWTGQKFRVAVSPF